MSKARQGRPWTQEDDILLKSMYKGGNSHEVAKKLGRSGGAVRNRAHRIGIAKARKSKSFRASASRSKHYKKALPEEKWPAMELFLYGLLKAADMAQARGIKPDVRGYMKEYARMGLGGLGEGEMINASHS
ncbi:MAG: SANT/Myb domain-containing protein [Firmicutes bacterium]|nr:SANT/Myb domain-containing protein [Bacillota bacterium]